MTVVLCVYHGFGKEDTAARLGNASHNRQIQVAGVFPSKKAFAEAALEAGLAYGRNAAAVVRYLSNYGYVHVNSIPEWAASFDLCALYVAGDMSDNWQAWDDFKS